MTRGKSTNKGRTRICRACIMGCVLAALAGPMTTGGCGIADPLNNVANQIEAAIAAIEIDSSRWREIVEQLQEDLPGLENDLKEDLQEVIDRGVSTIGVNVFASGDFVSRRVQEGLDRLHAKVTGRPVPVYAPAFVGFAPEVVDVARVHSNDVKYISIYGYDFDHLDPDGRSIELWIKRDGVYEDCSDKLDLATHYEATINLAANGVELDYDCSSLQFRWGERILGTLPILQPDPPEPEIITVDMASITFRPPHTRGDKDFKGHGPYVMLDVRITCADPVLGGCGGLMAQVYMFAEETESDWTRASGTSDWIEVYHTDPGYRIIDILSPIQCIESYTDTNHSEDVVCPGLGSLVECFTCTGDSDGDDAGVATKVSVDFAPCRIVVIKDDPYFN